MRRHCFLRLIWLGFLLFPLTTTHAERGIKVLGDLNHQNGALGTYRALIIGINDYQDETIPDLETAVSDAGEMAKVLQERYGFKIDLKKDLLLDRRATKEAIYKSLRDLASSAASSDSVLIYYAGHGDLDKLYDDGWWIPADAKAGNPLTYLDNVQVQKAMRSMQARHVLLISDSCYSGTLFGKSRAMPKAINDKFYLGLFNEKSRWGLTSGNKTPVADGGSGGHSVFAYQLLKALRNNQQPYMSTQEIYTRIAPIISNNSEVGQVPLCNPILRTGDQGGQFIFIASSAVVVDESAKKQKSENVLFSVTSNVPDAKVYVDGRYTGSTPFSEMEITPGKHKVRVTKEGYVSYEREITASQGWKKSIRAYLDRKPLANGRLNIHVTPQNAVIKLIDMAQLFSQGMTLAPGNYQLEVSADGYETYKGEVTLAGGEDKDLEIQLNPVELKNKITNDLDMAFVYIPPGSFMMGSPKNEADRNSNETPHKVTLTQGFYMQTTEVTQGQWKAVMGNNPSYFSNCGEDCPVEYITSDDVGRFISKLNQRERSSEYRLPTEAEWEYAARAGSSTRFCFGDSEESLKYYAWFAENAKRSTHPVARKQPNRWGLYDMHGNVWELVRDAYRRYPSSSVTDPEGSKLGNRILRGGCWSCNAENCRSAYRYVKLSDKRYGGFRLVCTKFKE